MQVAVNPVLLGPDTPAAEARLQAGSPPLLVEMEGGVGILNRSDLQRGGTAGELAVPVEPLSGDAPLSRVAAVMLEQGVDAVPVRGPQLLAVTRGAVMQALRDSPVAKRDALTLAREVPVIRGGGAAEGTSLVVNDSGKLVGISRGGGVARPVTVKARTSVKVVAGKLGRGPVAVVNRHREPLGVITAQDLLELAASASEHRTPIFYSGLGSLSQAEADWVRDSVAGAVARVEQVMGVTLASFRLDEGGDWSARLKVSTPVRTFTHSEREGSWKVAVRGAVEGLVNDVVADRKEKLVWRLV